LSATAVTDLRFTAGDKVPGTGLLLKPHIGSEWKRCVKLSP
jgi:hypothetical protein